MKNLSIAALLLLMSFNLTAQSEAVTTKSPFNPYVGLIFESTVSGGLAGLYAGAFVGKRIGFGAYFESPTSSFDNKFNENRTSYGGFFHYTILQENKLSMGLLLRAGLENERFVVVVPAISFGYSISPRFKLGFMGGYRYEKPSLGLTVGYRFKKP